MSDENKMPFEVAYEQTKDEIVNTINFIGQKNKMPYSILILLLENILLSLKSATYFEMLNEYNKELKDSEDSKNSRGDISNSESVEPVDLD